MFSAVRADGFDLGGRDQAIVCGIEAHICVSQTVHDLLERRRRGPCRASTRSARATPVDLEVGLRKMERAGAVLERGDRAVRALRAGGHARVQGRPAGDQVTRPPTCCSRTARASTATPSARAPRHRRGRLHDRHVRLSGVDDRPELRPPADHLHGAARRQLRRQRGGDGVRAHPRRRRDHARRGQPSDAPGAEQGWLDWLRRTGSRRSAAWTPARWSATSASGRHARRDLPGGDERGRGDGPVRAEPSMVGRDLAREVTVREPRPTATATARGSSRWTPASSARSCATSPARRGARALPVHDAGRRAARPRPRRFFLVPGPGIRGARLHRPDDPRAAVVKARVRDLPRPSAALARRGAGDLQAAVRPPWRQPPGQGRPRRPDRDHLAEPRLRGEGRGRGAAGVRARRGGADAREPLRPHRRGHPPARRPRGLRAVPPRGRPGPERLARLFDEFIARFEGAPA